MKKKQILIRIDEDVHTDFKTKVAKNKTSIQEVLEKAIKEYLDKSK